MLIDMKNKAVFIACEPRRPPLTAEHTCPNHPTPSVALAKWIGYDFSKKAKDFSKKAIQMGAGMSMGAGMAGAFSPGEFSGVLLRGWEGVYSFALLLDCRLPAATILYIKLYNIKLSSYQALSSKLSSYQAIKLSIYICIYSAIMLKIPKKSYCKLAHKQKLSLMPLLITKTYL